MSDVLYDMFCRKFPPIKNLVKRVSVYPPDQETLIERIYLTLYEKPFLKTKEPNADRDSLDLIAGQVFDDIRYEIDEHPEKKALISRS